jgi:indole-3-glycerol phosphate synthase
MLSDLTAGALEDAANRRQHVSYTSLEASVAAAPAPLDAYTFLEPSSHVKVIAEIKRASPSKGELSAIERPEELARTYQDSGASAVSVLTEERKFKGSLSDLVAVRKAVTIPILRKDFIAEEYQILEARAAGADIVLLIVAALDQQVLQRLFDFAHGLGLAVLVETHSKDEVMRALDINSRLIGVNARDLNTFDLNRNLFHDVVELIPEGVIKVAESAVRDVIDVQHYRDGGADVVLVGEALVTSDPKLTLSSFLAVS